MEREARAKLGDLDRHHTPRPARRAASTLVNLINSQPFTFQEALNLLQARMSPHARLRFQPIVPRSPASVTVHLFDTATPPILTVYETARGIDLARYLHRLHAYRAPAPTGILKQHARNVSGPGKTWEQAKALEEHKPQ